MTECPCCSRSMVRCILSQRVVWFCRSCWQEMPDLSKRNTYPLLKTQVPQQIVQKPALTH